MCETKMNDVARYATLLFYKNDDQIGGLDEKEQKELEELEEKLYRNLDVIERLKKLIEEMDTHGDVAKIWVKEVLLKKVLGEKNE